MSRPADDDLLAALRGLRAVALERRPSPYRTSFALEELDVQLEAGERLQLLFKDLGDRALDPAARAVKPAFLRDPRREIETYRRLLEPLRLGTARLFAAVLDERRDRYWLFLERVAGVELYQVGERATWEHVARWLARAHAALATAGDDVPELLRYDADWFRRWPARAIAHAADESARASLVSLAARYDGEIDRLLKLPTTVVHGEFYASNVLVDSPAEPSRVCPVDWEQAGRGPGLVDLAAHAGGDWPAEDRRAIALAYADEAGLEPEPMLRDLELCRLHLAFQWLGWAPEWSPPEEHAHDWLGEALRVADELEL